LHFGLAVKFSLYFLPFSNGAGTLPYLSVFARHGIPLTSVHCATYTCSTLNFSMPQLFYHCSDPLMLCYQEESMRIERRQVFVSAKQGFSSGITVYKLLDEKVIHKELNMHR
jgi:hypothetical protein